MFGRQALDARLMPQEAQDLVASGADRKRCHPVKIAEPAYPEDSRRHGVQGMVYAEFTVRPDGTARNPRIMFALPLKEFDPAVRWVLLHSRFGAGSAGSPPVHCTMTFKFEITNVVSRDYPGLERFVEKARHDAEAGDANAQTLYGMLLQGVPQLSKPRSEAMPWFVKAAQSGSPVGQYELGVSLLLGWGCNCEVNKALEWIRKAAEQDQPDAEVSLAEYSLRGKPDLEAVKRARIWLERAVQRDHRDGKLYLAALLATAPFAEERDPARALVLVDDVFRSVEDDPTAYEIRAAAQAARGDFENAVKSQRKAVSLARVLGWDLAPLNERLASYAARRPWQGDLLEL